MTNDLVKQSTAELQDLVRCRCHDAYKGRGLHDPTCCCDYAEALKVVSARIEELEAKLAKAELIVRIIASDKWNERLGEVVDLSCEYLAELTGGKDE